MALTRRLKNRVWMWLITLLVGMFVGATYSEFVYPADSPNPGDWKVGMVTAMVIGLFSMPLEIFSRDLRLMIVVRNLPMGLHWAVRSLMHLGIILVALLGTQWAFDTFWYHRVLFSTISVPETTQDAVFCSIILVVAVFVLEMRALLGGRVIANTLLGNYAAPALKHRIFMLVDMVKSSDAASMLGDHRFHGYLADTFRIVEAAVEDEGGEIYTFIGDGLIASWPLLEKSRNRGPLAAALRFLTRLDADAASFEERYGLRPRLRVALHGGPVILGQYGDVRRQVTYLGEVLNVASRIERFAKETNYEIVTSLDLLMQMPLPEAIATAPIPAAARDKWHGKVEIMALQRLGAASQLPSFVGKKPPPDAQLKAVK